MHARIQQKHFIDFLFPISLFFVFAVSALSVILMATRVYRSTTEQSSLNYSVRTTLSYVSEKLHQSDTDSSVSLGTKEGCEALIIEQAYEASLYYTYIYVYDGDLKEQFLKDGTAFLPANGKTITPVESFSVQELKTGLFSISCTDRNGKAASTIVNTRSTRHEQPAA